MRRACGCGPALLLFRRLKEFLSSTQISAARITGRHYGGPKRGAPGKNLSVELKLLPITDSGLLAAKERHDGYLNEQDLQWPPGEHHPAHHILRPRVRQGHWPQYLHSASSRSKHHPIKQGWGQMLLPKTETQVKRSAKRWKSHHSCTYEIFPQRRLSR